MHGGTHAAARQSSAVGLFAVPRSVPPEFKRDVVRVARRGDLGHAEVAADFDVSVESVRRWVPQADVDDGVVDGQTSREQNERVQLRRDKRRLEMENEILRCAATYFAARRLARRCTTTSSSATSPRLRPTGSG